jgi:hypothetical protein
MQQRDFLVQRELGHDLVNPRFNRRVGPGWQGKAERDGNHGKTKSGGAWCVEHRRMVSGRAKANQPEKSGG